MAIKAISADFPGEFQTPNTMAFTAAFDTQISEISTLFGTLKSIKSIDSASGRSLDLLGSTIGLTRKNAALITSGILTEYPITDANYRKLLKMQALKNGAIGTCDEVDRSLKLWNPNYGLLSAGNTAITVAGDINEEMIVKPAGVSLTDKVLPAPVISITRDILTITDMSGVATSYNIYVGTTLSYQGCTTTTFDLSDLLLPGGAYSIAVTAVNASWTESELSNSALFEALERLAAPVLSLSGDTLSWSAVTNATGYKIVAYTTSLGNYTMTTQNTSVDLRSWLSTYVPEGTSASIVGVTLADGINYEDSVASTAVSYTMEALATPVIFRSGRTVLITDSSPMPDEYDIYLDGTLADTIIL
ncbi:MAG: hypothetical protein IJS71_08235 [Clostridia bacterium]|nr:hypothetical protein [Clostridia bacterium]